MNDISMNSWNEENTPNQQKCHPSLTIEIPEPKLNYTTINPKPDIPYRIHPRYRYHISRAVR